jgi:hypothetical protein
MQDGGWRLRLGRTLVVYAAWLASSALLVGVLLVARATVRAIFIATHLDTSLYILVNNWSFVLLAVPVFGAVMYLEHYYRQSSRQGLLKRRFINVTLIELALAALFYVIGVLALHLGV